MSVKAALLSFFAYCWSGGLLSWVGSAGGTISQRDAEDRDGWIFVVRQQHCSASILPAAAAAYPAAYL